MSVLQETVKLWWGFETGPCSELQWRLHNWNLGLNPILESMYQTIYQCLLYVSQLHDNRDQSVELIWWSAFKAALGQALCSQLSFYCTANFLTVDALNPRINQTTSGQYSTEGATIGFPLTSPHVWSNVTQLSQISVHFISFWIQKDRKLCQASLQATLSKKIWDRSQVYVCALAGLWWTTHPPPHTHSSSSSSSPPQSSPPTIHYTTRSRPLCQASLQATVPRKWQHKVHSVPCHSQPQAHC